MVPCGAPTLYVDTTHALDLRFSPSTWVGLSYPHIPIVRRGVLPSSRWPICDQTSPESSGPGSKGVEESWAGSPLPPDQLCSPFSLVETLPQASCRKLSCQGSTSNAGVGVGGRKRMGFCHIIKGSCSLLSSVCLTLNLKTN